jgi:hypothetical protein
MGAGTASTKTHSGMGLDSQAGGGNARGGVVGENGLDVEKMVTGVFASRGFENVHVAGLLKTFKSRK